VALIRGTCQDAGISEQAVHEVLMKLDKYNCHSFMIIRNGIMETPVGQELLKQKNLPGLLKNISEVLDCKY
jgi:hypothetical protein